MNFNIINYTYQQNFSLFEDTYREITSLNYSVQTVANNLKKYLYAITSYNKACVEIIKPAIVGNDYMCNHHIRLWRSQQCGSDSSWFFKNVASY